MTARILVTGGAGFLGSHVVSRLEEDPSVEQIVSLDVQPSSAGRATVSVAMDVRDPAVVDVVHDHRIDRIVHLAAIVTPRPEHTREFLHSVDVGGTANVIRAAVEGGVDHLTVTSSGAAYGYHADNPDWIDESQPLRGNVEFAYSDHKRQVEENLAQARRDHPELKQLVLRPGTILGLTVDNQITALFEWPVILGIAGSDSPFVFIWDSDVVEVIARGVLSQKTGIYNLAGTGAVPMRQIAEELGKRYLAVPAFVVKGALALLHAARLAPYGPEQVDFLRYRPVLTNRRLIEEFGYEPAMRSLDAFRAWAAGRV